MTCAYLYVGMDLLLSSAFHCHTFQTIVGLDIIPLINAFSWLARYLITTIQQGNVANFKQHLVHL
jgi:hypothetical protein